MLLARSGEELRMESICGSFEEISRVRIRLNYGNAIPKSIFGKNGVGLVYAHVEEKRRLFLMVIKYCFVSYLELIRKLL